MVESLDVVVVEAGHRSPLDLRLRRERYGVDGHARIAARRERQRIDSPPPMDLYEYQGKELFARFGIPVSEGRLATTPEEARAAAEELGGQVVVKAQVLTGGRGKAGGIKLAEIPDEAAAARERDPRAGHPRPRRPQALDRAGLGHRQGVLPLGHVRPRREEAAVHAHDARAASTSRRSPRRRPDALARLHVDPLVGFQPYQARWLCFTAGIDRPGRAEAGDRASSGGSTTRSSAPTRCSARSTR